ncbi:MAG: response regulator transcription factor [Sphingomonadales bacterium]|nr:response regulator transcription factor [Sphingomonadales bacterium]PIX66315.1 MAG: DNA-binding response regulator [Sphingomonadales bacterium CG_4_10_14_3_um_filter_58_15]NCO49231.1 response regulator transcription factor [Sphingomonadales bacterium]NCP00145.1 response regulator transcription factor [Sphingomonadales bacterium]NCP25775.1 response regulator transcription factor [Sphingomonadales bacterium]
MTHKIHILLVDDEASLREPLAEYLIKQGYKVQQASDASIARSLLNAYDFDITLLDIMMPGEDGLSLCRFVTDKTDIPVIFISAKTEETERIIGLELGADDYITKPFSPRELVARIKVILRRAERGGTKPLGTSGGGYQFSGWTLKSDKRSLIDADGVNVSLSTGEYQMLLALVSRAGKVLNRDQLLDITQGREAHAFDRAVDNQISRLRRKIESDPKNPEIIKTVWGGGYMLAGEVKSL